MAPFSKFHGCVFDMQNILFWLCSFIVYLLNPTMADSGSKIAQCQLIQCILKKGTHGSKDSQWKQMDDQCTGVSVVPISFIDFRRRV